MERRKFTREFKLEAVRLIKDRGVSYVQVSQDLSVHPSQLRDWVKKFADDPQHAFPGHGQMKPEQLEIARLKREVAKLKAERDILKNVRGSLSSCGHRKGCDMYYRRRGERPLAFWWHQPRKKTWSMGCCGLESVTRSSDPG
jgi:transposase